MIPTVGIDKLVASGLQVFPYLLIKILVELGL